MRVFVTEHAKVRALTRFSYGLSLFTSVEALVKRFKKVLSSTRFFRFAKSIGTYQITDGTVRYIFAPKSKATYVLITILSESGRVPFDQLKKKSKRKRK